MQENKPQNPHLENIVRKVVTDFGSMVRDEKNPSNLLLKGHLFAENLLEETLAVFDVKNKHKNSFHEKVKSLNEIKVEGVLKDRLQSVSALLFALNEVRNDLAHNLHFIINEATVNKIGILLGSEFIVRKYETGQDKVLENLSFCLDEIMSTLGNIIYIKVEELKTKKKNGGMKTNPASSDQ